MFVFHQFKFDKEILKTFHTISRINFYRFSNAGRRGSISAVAWGHERRKILAARLAAIYLAADWLSCRAALLAAFTVAALIIRSGID